MSLKNRSTGILKAVAQLLYRKYYKVKGIIMFGLCFVGFGHKLTEKPQIPSNNFGHASIYNIEMVISLNSF